MKSYIKRSHHSILSGRQVYKCIANLHRRTNTYAETSGPANVISKQKLELCRGELKSV